MFFSPLPYQNLRNVLKLTNLFDKMKKIQQIIFD